jgi:hypothetical protein
MKISPNPKIEPGLTLMSGHRIHYHITHLPLTHFEL